MTIPGTPDERSRIVKNILAQNGLSVLDAAKLTGLSRPSIAKMRDGDPSVQQLTFDRFVAALDKMGIHQTEVDPTHQVVRSLPIEDLVQQAEQRLQSAVERLQQLTDRLNANPEALRSNAFDQLSTLANRIQFELGEIKAKSE